jgi:hypothetical protein
VRKKIIGISVIIAVLAILCTQPVAAQGITINAWTDKPQYNPGENGILKISMLNGFSDPISIYNITIVYPWHAYDANTGNWVGNDTIKGTTNLLATMTEKGSSEDHYYKEVSFPVPGDGRADSGTISIVVATSDGTVSGFASVVVATNTVPMSLANLSTWTTYLIVAGVVCTIILAIVILLATRKTRMPSALASRAPPPPKTKAE